MDSALDLVFLIGLVFFFNHELDAIQEHEWRFFFSRLSISDENAYRIFTALHLPLFVFILWNLQSDYFQIGFDLFLILHAGLHWLLRHHPQVTFDNRFSRFWIFGGALLGCLHLIMLQR